MSRPRASATVATTLVERLQLRISPAVVQIRGKAINYTTLRATAALSSLRMFHSSLRLETNCQLMT